MLGRLGLDLLRGLEIGNKGKVDEYRVLASELLGELPYCLKEGKGLDVAYGAADLDDGDVMTGAALLDVLLDAVGDVRNDLDGCAKIVAVALAPQNLGVNLAGGVVVVAGHPGADEALVVSEVEVSLSAVLSYEYLTVLNRAHGARIYVYIRIKLKDCDVKPAGLEKSSERACSYTLAK